jgi:hypothetical protein
MKRPAKKKQADRKKRDLFSELRQGMAALAEARQGKRTLRAHVRRRRGAKTLLERARKYIGSVNGPLKPRNVAAQAKVLVRGIIAEKHSR